MFASATIPAGLGADGMTPDEQRQFESLRMQMLLGRLIHMIPVDVPVFEYIIRGGEIQAMPKKPGTDDEQRFVMRRLAKVLGFEYTDRPHNGSKDRIAAVGEIDGVRVELWNLVSPCHCSCHSEVAK